MQADLERAEATPETYSDSSPDEALVCAVLSGSRDAFNVLIHRHYGMVYAVVLSRLRDIENAEDIAQDAFIRAYENLGRLQSPRYFSTWIVRIARNLAADTCRRRESESARVIPFSEVLDDATGHYSRSEVERLSATEEKAFLNRSLRRLDPIQREIVLLHYGEGWALTHIAERLGMHRSTVSRLHAGALESLKSELEPILRGGCRQLCSRGAGAAKLVSCIALIASQSPPVHAALLPGSVVPGAIVTVSGSASAASSGSTISSVGAAILMKKAAVVIAAVGAIAGSGYYIRRQAYPDLRIQEKAVPLITNAGGPGTPFPRYFVSISDSVSTEGTISLHGRTGISATGAKSDGLLMFAYMHEYESHQLDFARVKASARKDITVRVPDDQPEMFIPVLRHVIQDAYQVTATPQKREMDVYVLKSGGAKPGLTVPRNFNNTGERVLPDMSPKNLCRFLKPMLGRPVINEAGLSGKFTAKASWTLSDFQVSIDSKPTPLNLTIEATKREVDTLVFRQL